MSWLDKLLGRTKKPAADAPRDVPPPPDMPATPPPADDSASSATGSDAGGETES